MLAGCLLVDAGCLRLLAGRLLVACWLLAAAARVEVVDHEAQVHEQFVPLLLHVLSCTML